jgi:uncharacterized membrane protein YhhN
MIKITSYRPISWLYIFFVVFISDLVAIYLEEETFRHFTKPYLMISLIMFFIRETALKKSELKKFIIPALLFSLLGDVLLLFESRNENYFIFGLVAFLIAHIFYILFFEKIIVNEGQKKRYWIFLPVMIYYVILISVLSPTLDDMKWPVRVYGIVISYMLIKAMQTGWVKDRKSILFFISGAGLFVISDTLLSLNKFYQPIAYAGIFIMITYGFAQLLITAGAVRYITKGSK